MSEQKLEELVNEYASLAKDDKIDTTALLINALEQEDQNRISTKTKRWAYLISIGAPPFGLIFVFWFYFSGKSDGKNAAMACLILTIVSSAITVILFKSALSGAGVSTKQLEQIKPADVYQLGQ
ncbi:MAG TPA: hypothetical protein VHQ41_00505 [Patescibacteria group bacterium]|nr:hypothetical protein [Patescibacteria group bacterium]